MDGAGREIPETFILLDCDLIHTFSDGRIGQIRPLILLGLRGVFFDPFCYSADALVDVVDYAALLLEFLV